MRAGDGGTKSRVIGETGPGRKPRHGDRRNRNAGEHVRHLLDVCQQTRERERREACELRGQSERTDEQPGGDERWEDRQRQRVCDRRDRRKNVKVGRHHRKGPDLRGAGDREGLTKDGRHSG